MTHGGRYVRLARGAAWRRRYPVQGGERVELFGPVHVSHPHPRVQVRLARSVRLYQQVGIYLDAPGAVVEIGNGTYVNRRTEITCKERITIGADCAISWDVLITDTDYHQLAGSKAVEPVTIGDHVWVGARASILKGVSVGDGAVIAAGALVTADVPSATLVAGAPAKVIRRNVEWA